MRNAVVSLLTALVVATAGPGQQPNTPGRARMRFNGNEGPSWPITGVSLALGVLQPPHVLGLEGAAGAPFIVAGTDAVLPAGVPAAGGLLDLDLSSGFAIAADGLSDPVWSIGPGGGFEAPFTLPAGSLVGSQRAFQGMVADPTVPSGATLTAASVVTVSPLVFSQLLNLGSNTYTVFSLTPFGLLLPFYNNTYNQLYINQDGSVSFTAGSGAFASSPAAFLAGMPMIAGFWSDLEPGAQSFITVWVVQNNPTPPFVQVNWVNMMEWNASGTPHSVSIRIYAAPVGDVQIIHGAANNAAALDPILVGLSPGGNLSTAAVHPQKNLSNLSAASPYAGCPNENFHEWFGLTTMPYYTAGFNNPWDLAGRTLTFQRTFYTPGVSTGCPVGTAAGWGYLAF